MFCEIGDVEKHLGRASGSAWTTDDIELSILDATNEIKSEIGGGAVDSDTITLWDSGDAPEIIKLICSRLAAAYILERKSGQSLRGDSRAAGLYRTAREKLDNILEKKIVLIDSDNEQVSTSHAIAKVTNDTQVQHFSIGNEGDDSEGTLDYY